MDIIMEGMDTITRLIIKVRARHGKKTGEHVYNMALICDRKDV